MTLSIAASKAASGKRNVMPDSKTARRLSDSQRDTMRHMPIGKPCHALVGKAMAERENDERA